MSLLPNPLEWAVHNARRMKKVRKYGKPFFSAMVRGPRNKNGRTRWECMVSLAPDLEFCFFIFATKAEAVAKAVELVMAGLVMKCEGV